MKTTLKEAQKCPRCGKPMPAGALAGFCPACLLAHGGDTESGDGKSTARFQPPSLGEIAKLFPQLEILGLLGAGGMGAVYKARQPALDRIVALKVLPAAGVAGANFEERFNREARALARLSHPNIVGVHEFGQAGALHFFVMEFVDGANLRQLERAGRLSPREALQLIPQICDALQYAHDEGVVHRDIKPENVLVDRKGRVKIADFGLAKILGQDAEALRLTREGQVMGTPHYMAPEQVERPLSVDHRVDIYSLGVVLYEMLTGDLPIGKFSPPSRKVQVDVRFDDVVLRALENDPERRYQHVSEVKTQVENIEGTPPPVMPASPPVPDEHFVHWMNFPVVVERDGQRQVNQKGALKAFGIIFGVITLAFLFVSLLTGRTFFGWLGISGGLSLAVRLLVSALLVVGGIWRVWSRPVEGRLPQAPNGTVILPSSARGWKVARDWVVSILLMILAWNAFIAGWPKLSPWLRARFGNASVAQVAARDASSGALVATLPNGGTMELLAIAHDHAAADEFWRPDGTPLAPVKFEIKTPGQLSVPNTVEKDLVFRLVNLPDGVVFPLIESEPSSGHSTGDTVRCDGQLLDNVWPVRMAWPDSVRTATLRLGVNVLPWHTLATYHPASSRTMSTRQSGDPKWSMVFHLASEHDGQSQITVVRSLDNSDGNWQTRLVAVDSDGVEHGDLGGKGTKSENTSAWTSTFSLPLARIKEFRAQIRPLHWVEFRNVALRSDSSATSVTRKNLALARATQSSGDDSKSLTQEGWQIWSSGRPAEAIPLFKRAVELSPSFAEAWSGLGWANLNSGNGSEAEKAFRQVIELNPGHPGALNGLGQHFLARRNYSEAEAYFLKAAPRAPAAWFGLAKLYLLQGKFTEAEKWARQLVDLGDGGDVAEQMLQAAKAKNLSDELRALIEPRALPDATTSAPADKFGPEMQLTFRELLDLDTGKLGEFPTDKAVNNPFEGMAVNLAWMQEHGFDVIAGADKLEIVGLKVVEIAPKDWNTISPAELQRQLDERGKFPSELQKSTAEYPALPVGFRTREGGVGLLSIIKFGDPNGTVTVRYKTGHPGQPK